MTSLSSSNPARGGPIAPSETSAEPSALVGLLARVEAATGPDRELDYDLCAVLFGATEAATIAAKKGNMGGLRMPGPFYSELRIFTASLGAALALKDRVLPNHAAAAGDMAFEGNPRLPWGCIWSPGGFIVGQAEARTPALALLAAMLKALIAANADTSERNDLAREETQ